MKPTQVSEDVRIPIGGTVLPGELSIPADPHGVVLFAHGSGSSRLSPRNRHVAEVLQDARFATLLFDLLSEDEDHGPEARFDIELLTTRLLTARHWIAGRSDLARLRFGFFGASTGAAAALRAAAAEPLAVGAVVSRGGRPDLAFEALQQVIAPTLFIVGGGDPDVLDLNLSALERLRCEKRMAIVPGAGHLFDEPGALERVAELARRWFESHLVAERQGIMIFRDREHAAHLLAAALHRYKGKRVLVRAIPRGAVPMGRIIADALGGDLDVVLVRKLVAPNAPELAIGAVDETGETYLPEGLDDVHVPPGYVEMERARQLAVLRERRVLYTPDRASISPAGRIVIVLDDGIATGATMIAALRATRRKDPMELIAASGVIARETFDCVASEADRVVFLQTPQYFGAVGHFFPKPWWRRAASSIERRLSSSSTSSRCSPGMAQLSQPNLGAT